MPRNDLLKLVLSEIQDLKTEVREVRQTDIPNVSKLVAILQTEITNVKEKTSIRSMIITGIGGLIAVATSVAVAYFK